MKRDLKLLSKTEIVSPEKSTAPILFRPTTTETIGEAADQQLAPKFRIFEGPVNGQNLSKAALNAVVNGESVLEAPSDEDFWAKFHQ